MIISAPSARATRCSRSSFGQARAPSSRAMLGCFVRTRSASCFCERPAFSRMTLNSCARRYLLKCASSPAAKEGLFFEPVLERAADVLVPTPDRHVCLPFLLLFLLPLPLFLENLLHAATRDVQVGLPRPPALLLAPMHNNHRRACYHQVHQAVRISLEFPELPFQLPLLHARSIEPVVLHRTQHRATCLPINLLQRPEILTCRLCATSGPEETDSHRHSKIV